MRSPGGEDAAQALLDNGADPTACIEGGATPLHAAAEAGSLPTVKALLQVYSLIRESVCCPRSSLLPSPGNLETPNSGYIFKVPSL
jgi:ankyrin repeat protein